MRGDVRFAVRHRDMDGSSTSSAIAGAFQQRCLRRLMRISWKEGRTNVSVRKQAVIPSVEARLAKMDWSLRSNT